jgi:hypothetical protein
VSKHPGLTTTRACLERAVAIKETGKTLYDLGDDWHAVCYFYAAYHTVRAAFIEDPVFQDVKRLTATSQHLTPQDRYAKHHQARMGTGPRILGVNDIVALIYPQIAIEYRRLHSASIDVRYGPGLTGIAGTTVLADYETVTKAYLAGELVAP